MGTIEIAPDLLVPGSEHGSRTLGGGAPSVLSALQDASDSTYVAAAGASPSDSYGATFRMASFTLPAGAVVSRIQMRMRYTHFVKLLSGGNITNEYWNPVTILVGRLSGGQHKYDGFSMGEAVPSYSGATSPIQGWLGPYRTGTFDAKYHFNQLLSKPGARLYASIKVTRNWAYNLARLMRFTLLVHYNEPPVITLSDPIGTLTSSRVILRWTWSDADNDPQALYQVRIYTSAVATNPNFDVEDLVNYPPVYARDVWSNKTFHVTEQAISPNGNYVAYVRATHAGVGPVVLWSNWVSSAFTQNVVVPTAPTVTAAYQPALNAVKVQVSTTNNLLSAHQSTVDETTNLSPSFSTGVSAGGVTLSKESTTVLNGTRALRLAKSGSTGTMSVWTSAVPVVAGQQYTALSSVRAVTTARSARVIIRWRNASGLIIGTSNGTASNDASGSWGQRTVTATAPAGSASAEVGTEWTSVPSGEAHLADQLDLHRGTGTTWSIGGFLQSNEQEIQRSLDNGDNWEAIPQSQITQLGADLLEFWDYQIPAGNDADYRARVTTIDINGDELTSDWSALATAGIPALTSWWLRDLQDVALSMPISVRSMKMVTPRPMTVDWPIGSTGVVVTHDGTKRDRIDLVVNVLDRAGYEMFRNIVDSGNVLQLQDNLGGLWYVVPDDGTEYERLLAQPLASELTTTRHAHTVSITFHGVEKPTI